MYSTVLKVLLFKLEKLNTFFSALVRDYNHSDCLRNVLLLYFFFFCVKVLCNCSWIVPLFLAYLVVTTTLTGEVKSQR